MLMDLKWIVCVFRFRIPVLAWSNDANVEICYCMSEVSTYDIGCVVFDTNLKIFVTHAKIQLPL